MSFNEYYTEKFHDEYAIKKRDTIIAIVDSGTNARKICDELNTIFNENKMLKNNVRKLSEDVRFLAKLDDDKYKKTYTKEIYHD